MLGMLHTLGLVDYVGDDRYLLNTTAAAHNPTLVLTFIRLFVNNGLSAQMKATFEA